MVETFVSNMTKDEVVSWVKHIIKVRLGELVYSDPCPRGSSIVKGHENYKVREFLYIVYIYYILGRTTVMLTVSAETQGPIDDRLRD
jgi:hypothetical protein